MSGVRMAGASVGWLYLLCTKPAMHSFLFALCPHSPPRPAPPTPRPADKGQRVLGRPFWRHYAHGIIDWLVVNVVLYLCLAAQVCGLGVRKGGLLIYVAERARCQRLKLILSNASAPSQADCTLLSLRVPPLCHGPAHRLHQVPAVLLRVRWLCGPGGRARGEHPWCCGGCSC